MIPLVGLAPCMLDPPTIVVWPLTSVPEVAVEPSVVEELAEAKVLLVVEKLVAVGELVTAKVLLAGQVSFVFQPLLATQVLLVFEPMPVVQPLLAAQVGVLALLLSVVTAVVQPVPSVNSGP